MLLEVLRYFVDFLRQDTDLHLWGTSVLVVCAELRDEFLLGGLLESHREWVRSEEATKTVLRASVWMNQAPKRESMRKYRNILKNVKIHVYRN